MCLAHTCTSSQNRRRLAYTYICRQQRAAFACTSPREHIHTCTRNACTDRDLIAPSPGPSSLAQSPHQTTSRPAPLQRPTVHAYDNKTSSRRRAEPRSREEHARTEGSREGTARVPSAVVPSWWVFFLAPTTFFKFFPSHQRHTIPDEGARKTRRTRSRLIENPGKFGVIRQRCLPAPRTGRCTIQLRG
jgi:hypothetical protein